MNQGMRNSRRHTAALSGQLVKRGNGDRIAQHDCNGSASGAVLGDALSAGLWLRHGSSLNQHQVRNRIDRLREDAHFARNLNLGDQGAVAAHFRNYKAAFSIASFAEVPEHHQVAVFHFHLRSGPIPPMSESYSLLVTQSTGIYT